MSNAVGNEAASARKHMLVPVDSNRAMTYIRPSSLVAPRIQRRSFARPDRLASQTLLTADLRRKIKMINTALELATGTSEIVLPISRHGDLAMVESAVEGQTCALASGDSIDVDDGLPWKMTNVGVSKPANVIAFASPDHRAVGYLRMPWL